MAYVDSDVVVLVAMFVVDVDTSLVVSLPVEPLPHDDRIASVDTIKIVATRRSEQTARGDITVTLGVPWHIAP